MIATPFFVYLHLHKSGGTFLNECLLRFVPGARQIGYHLPRSRIPESLRYLPVLGFVRNPWSYYVSWYFFQSALPEPNHLFLCVSRNRSLEFNRTVQNLLTLSRDPVGLDEVLRGLPDRYGSAGLNLPAFALEGIRDTGSGFYSFLYQYLFRATGLPATIARSENLRQELPAILQHFGFQPPAEMIDYLRQKADANPSTHRHYSTYYNDQLRDLVAETDQSVIRLHGYSFDPPPTEPT